jgi:hypothetical protein
MRDLLPARRIVGDKAPHYVIQLATLAPISQLALLVVVRDARDAVSSALRMMRHRPRQRDKPASVEAQAEYWVRCVEAVEAYPHRVRVMRYEHLVRRPDHELEQLGGWLDVDPEGFPEQMIHDSSIGSYKTGLTRDELDTVMRVAGPAMERQGYLS